MQFNLFLLLATLFLASVHARSVLLDNEMENPEFNRGLKLSFLAIKADVQATGYDCSNLWEHIMMENVSYNSQKFQNVPLRLIINSARIQDFPSYHSFAAKYHKVATCLFALIKRPWTVILENGVAFPVTPRLIFTGDLRLTGTVEKIRVALILLYVSAPENFKWRLTKRLEIYDYAGHIVDFEATLYENTPYFMEFIDSGVFKTSDIAKYGSEKSKWVMSRRSFNYLISNLNGNPFWIMQEIGYESVAGARLFWIEFSTWVFPRYNGITVEHVFECFMVNYSYRTFHFHSQLLSDGQFLRSVFDKFNGIRGSQNEHWRNWVMNRSMSIINRSSKDKWESVSKGLRFMNDMRVRNVNVDSFTWYINWHHRVMN